MEGQWNKKNDEGVLEIDVPSSICSLCFSGFFCFVVFLLVSCFFSLSNYTGLSVTICGGMLDWLPLGLPINTPLHPTYREDELKVAFIVGSLGPFPRHT